MPANPGFQLSLDVKGRTCLVLGGGDEAAEKAQRLLEAGAKITIVSPTLNDTLRKLTASAKVLHRGRLFRASDTEGVILVINTLRGDQDFSKSLLELAKKERFLLWSMDQSEWSTVSMPAVVSCGHLRLAISTSGVAPALASRLRQDLEQVLNEECVAFLDWLAALRDETKEAEPDAEKRRVLLREAVNGFKLNGSIEFPKAWLEERAKQKA
ncbi:MAG TPA: bifunctional precorrin-2 dehydrogenase/sirohydrochlorin ferrochelatase [Nitrospiraceae bacterium]|nr:bifunctional precorrin-2 dehydrogenase/sirohydrochlorin ferrochelatase [Nitrospiraceae bacterium]